MKPTNWKLLVLLIYLFISSVLGVSVAILITSLIVDLFFLIFYKIPFDFSSYDLWKLWKIGLIGGSFIGVGTWVSYVYRLYRQN